MKRKASILHPSDIELLRGSKRDVPVWDSHVMDHLNYQDAYQGEADEIEVMAHAIAMIEDVEDANQIAAALNLDFEPAEPDEDPVRVWNDLVQELARASYNTWRTSGLPAGQYNLGVLDDEFGFVFHADEEDTDMLREHLYGDDERDAGVRHAARNVSQDPIVSAQQALALTKDIGAEALIRHWPYEIGRAVRQAQDQLEYLIGILHEHFDRYKASTLVRKCRRFVTKGYNDVVTEK